jgi:agmatine deiminase
MAWPTRSSLWGELFDQAKSDYADVARAIANFEPVVMICQPGDAADVSRHCGSAVQVTEIAIDDSWTRDSGPVFVVNDRADVAVVNFGFNSWGGKYLPYDHDAALGTALADVLGTRCYQAPFVLEGGAFYVDGEGTLFTTDGPVLDPARNAGTSREQFEQVVGAYLGIDKVVWLVAYPDRDTDGHIDGIAQLIEPGQILLLAPDEPGHPNYRYGRQNLDTLADAVDARGRMLRVVPFGITASAPAGTEVVDLPYLNCYLANGGVVVPLAGTPEDGQALSRLREVFAGREVIGVPGATLSYGGGGPHCITQQMPLGRAVPA